MNRRMVSELASQGIEVLDVYVCPHHWDEQCACRKPAPGLFLRASREHLLRMDRTVYIGDDPRDSRAAFNAECLSVLVGPERDLDPGGGARPRSRRRPCSKRCLGSSIASRRGRSRWKGVRRAEPATSGHDHHAAATQLRRRRHRLPRLLPVPRRRRCQRHDRQVHLRDGEAAQSALQRDVSPQLLEDGAHRHARRNRERHRARMPQARARRAAAVHCDHVRPACVLRARLVEQLRRRTALRAPFHARRGRVGGTARRRGVSRRDRRARPSDRQAGSIRGGVRRPELHRVSARWPRPPRLGLAARERRGRPVSATSCCSGPAYSAMRETCCASSESNIGAPATR